MASVELPGTASSGTAATRSRPPVPWHVWVALGVVVLLAAGALAAPWISPFDPDRTNLLRRLRPPAPLGGHPAHWLGTDQLGRDLLSRSLHALRTSVAIGLLGCIVSTLIGTAVGLAAGYLRGRVDAVLSVIVDTQIALPYLLIVLVGLAVFGTDVHVLIPLVSLAGWEGTARLVRGQVMGVAAQPFVTAAEALGARPREILWRHVLPHVLPVLLVQFTLNFPGVLLLESSLSFLGIGVQPPTASLGRMIGEGRHQMLAGWWVVAVPVAVILAITLALQVIGDWLSDRLDVRRR
jgi:peptide/nickel transport system permease protein